MLRLFVLGSRHEVKLSGLFLILETQVNSFMIYDHEGLWNCINYKRVLKIGDGCLIIFNLI